MDLVWLRCGLLERAGGSAIEDDDELAPAAAGASGTLGDCCACKLSVLIAM